MTNPKKDGPPARLSSFIPFLVLTAAPCLLPWIATAREDLFEAAFGLDYLRDIGAAPSAPAPSWPASAPFPGFSPWHSADSLPPIGGSLGSVYENLIRKTGDPAFAHAGFSSTAEARIGLIPGMDLRSSLERGSIDRRIGDTSLVLDESARGWESRSTIAFPVSTRVTPMVGIGWNSGSGREQALLGLTLRGRGAHGITWSLSSGRRSQDFPLHLDLPEYRPMTVPFQLRQDFHAASIAVKKGPAEIAWSGRLRLLRRADRQAEAYALTDSGSLADQTLELTLSAPGPGGLWRGEARLESGSGRHFFRGTNLRGDGRYQFGYLQALQRSLSTMGNLSLERNRRRFSAFVGASALEWNAYRPPIPAGKQFWDRNNVLDSYEGSVIGVFNRETWLFDGDVTLLRVFSGAKLEGPLAGRLWGRLGLAWQRLDLSAASHITKRTSTLLIAFTQEEITNELPGLTAHLLTPDLAFSIPLGKASLEAAVSQAIPLSFEVKKKGGGGGGGSGGGTSRYSGGTRAGLTLQYELP